MYMYWGISSERLNAVCVCNGSPIHRDLWSQTCCQTHSTCVKYLWGISFSVWWYSSDDWTLSSIKLRNFQYTELCTAHPMLKWASLTFTAHMRKLSGFTGTYCVRHLKAERSAKDLWLTTLTSMFLLSNQRKVCYGTVKQCYGMISAEGCPWQTRKQMFSLLQNISQKMFMLIKLKLAAVKLWNKKDDGKG